jgi:urease accessory protein
MGATPTRITEEDFVTPPEFSHWSLTDSSAGRIGGVRLELSAVSEGAKLGKCYQQIPLRVLPPFRFGSGQPSLLYLLNPTAGLMDGDGHFIQIRAPSGVRAMVTGQSATRIHPAVHGFSTQQWHVQVDAGAVLVVLPGPAIPFQGSRYYQRVRIDLEPGAGLVWGDLWFAGRYARDKISERFQFEIIIQDFTVHRENRLVFRDRFAWRGPWDTDQATRHFGPHLACGSLFVTRCAENSAPPIRRACQTAFFQTGANDTCIRWLGTSEEITRELVKTALQSAGQLCQQESPDPWLPAFQHLAPNHWFMQTYWPRDTVPDLEPEIGIPSGSGRPAPSNSRSYR